MNKIDNPLPLVSDLLALRELAESGTVSKASEKLGMTQSALSYALKRMRKRFGDPLFVRVGNRMEPTPYAQQLQEPAQRVLRILENEMSPHKRFDPKTTDREFRVAVNEIGAITLVPQLIQRLAMEAPGARLNPVYLDTKEIGNALAAGTVDVCAGRMPKMPDGLMQQLLFRRQYVCVARAGHPTVGDALTFKEFARTPQVLTPAIVASISWIEDQLRREGLKLVKTIISHHVAAVPFIVAATDFVAIIPEEVFDLFLPITKLKKVALPIEIPPVDIRQYWHPRVAADPAIKFLTGLLSRVSQR